MLSDEESHMTTELKPQMPATETDSAEPKVHTAHIRQAMKDLVGHLRRDIENVKEPRARVLFETTAEVLLGLIKTYDDYDVAKETAFRK
jgi:hypothetical protein